MLLLDIPSLHFLGKFHLDPPLLFQQKLITFKLLLLHRLNGNTVPITTWIMIELIKDPTLFRLIRSEALSCYTLHSETGESRIDAQKLVKLPLMQSIYIEALRMHVSFNVTRKTTQPIIIDGYPIEKGALVQTCSEIAHYEEGIWGVEGHPADEFWAWRHVKYVESVNPETGVKRSLPQFVMRGRPSSFFPYGKLFFPILNCLLLRKFLQRW